MKAKELRIGNFVGYVDNLICVMSVRENDYISGVLLSKAMDAIEMEDWIRFGIRKDFSLDYDIIKPIPLTEEWLLKFGFKYQDRDVNRGDSKTGRFYISPHFGEYREYWIELQLDNNPFKHSFVWLNWDIGGGRDYIHLPQGHELKYVHQLQNLYFALSGNELTIEK